MFISITLILSSFCKYLHNSITLEFNKSTYKSASVHRLYSFNSLVQVYLTKLNAIHSVPISTFHYILIFAIRKINESALK